MPKTNEDQYSEKETTKRMENALRHALTTPPKPHAQMKGKTKASPEPPKARKGR